MTDAPTANDMMSAYASDAVDYCQQAFGLPLDFSEESIKSIEEVLTRLHASLPRGFQSRLFKRGPSPEQIDTICKMLGGYVGEVMRRHWGGAWKLGSGRPGAGHCHARATGRNRCLAAVQGGQASLKRSRGQRMELLPCP